MYTVQLCQRFDFPDATWVLRPDPGAPDVVWLPMALGPCNLLKDITPYQLDGAINLNMDWQVMPQFGWCAAAPGGNRNIDIAHDAMLSLGTAFTLAGWVWFTSNVTSGIHCIFCKGDTSGAPHYGLWANVFGSNQLNFYDGAAWHTINYTSGWSANDAYHIAITYDGSAVSFYVNGVSIGTSACTRNITSASDAFRFMAQGNTNSNALVGVLGPWFFYSGRGLGPADVLALHDPDTRWRWLRPGPGWLEAILKVVALPELELLLAASGTATTGSVPAVTRRLSQAAAGGSSAALLLELERQLAAGAAGQGEATLIGRMARELGLAAGGTSAAALAADVVRRLELGAAGNTAAQLEPRLERRIELQAVGTGTAGVEPSVERELPAGAAGRASAVGTARVVRELGLGAAGSAIAALTLRLEWALTALASGTAEAETALRALRLLAAGASGQAEATLTVVGLAIQLALAANGTAGAELTMSLSRLLALSTEGVGVGQVALRLQRLLASEAAGRASGAVEAEVARLLTLAAAGNVQALLELDTLAETADLLLAMMRHGLFLGGER